jgi:outer membrane protein assembly factor BamE (lipoprotein component of BamABCDE complex)
MPRVKYSVRRILVAVAFAALILTGIKHVFIDNRPRDILFAAISAPSGDSTIYAQGYSESKFRSLRVGMTPRQVEEIMGPPFERGQW